MWRLYFIIKVYKITYGKNGDTHELYKSEFSGAKALYFNYKKHYMSLKDKTAYFETKYLNGVFKDMWEFSVIVGTNRWIIRIVPIEID